jgi:hypothetical protein
VRLQSIGEGAWGGGGRSPRTLQGGGGMPNPGEVMGSPVAGADRTSLLEVRGVDGVLWTPEASHGREE